MSEIAITGVGIATPVGQGKIEVERALLQGANAFRVMQRTGRQFIGTAFLGAEIEALQLPDRIPPKLLRTLSWSAKAALATVAEAWLDARLTEVGARRIGLVIGGSNVQQRELVLQQDAFRDRFDFLRPTYGQMFMDTDVAAICTEHFGINGFAWTCGGASASGHLAIIQAIQAVESGQVDACIAVGALMDLSYWECQAFRALGAMGSDKFAHDPAAACRPFDRRHDGFIYGENCGAVVIERRAHARTEPYAAIRGWSYVVDGHRNPDPSVQGEMQAIEIALAKAGWAATDIDYVNPHGTGSLIGDAIELEALENSGFAGTSINATKSILGHGLSAAGTVEVVATLLQMRAGRLHPTRNLEDPISTNFAWVRSEAVSARLRRALTLSFGFGGINSALCLESYSN
jgi:malonyl-ACP decarboxylase